MVYKCSNNPLISISLKEAGARLIFIFLILLLTTANSSLYAESTNQNILITYKENVLSISAKDADLKKVLFELAEETSIDIRLPLSLDKKITINRSGISLNEGLKDILRHLNYIILYSGIKDNKLLISKVIIFPKSKISTTLPDGKIQQTNSEIPSATREDSSATREDSLATRIKFYERQIESLKQRLSKIDENSRLGRKYSRQIKRFEKLIEKNEFQLNQAKSP
jgi:hypothetical protein